MDRSLKLPLYLENLVDHIGTDIFVDLWFICSSPGGGAAETGRGTTSNVGAKTEVGRRRAAPVETRTGSDSEQKERSATTLILTRRQAMISGVVCVA